MDLSRFKLIWCEVCEAKQPFKIDVMDEKAADLQCSVCDFVIATLHDAPPA